MARAAKYAAVVLLLAVTLLVLLVLPPAPRHVTLSASPNPLVVKGALHVHTVRSDGGGTVDDVAAAASAAGLAFVVVTDHGDGRVIDPPAYRSGVLCLDGAEISTTQGHVLAIGSRPAEYPLGGEARDVIDDIHRLGGMAIVAHPGSPKADLAWRAWDAPFDGVEWLNADSEWRDERTWDLARLTLGYWLRPSAAVARMFDRPTSVLERVDADGGRRPIVLTAGHDAHARLGQGIEDRGGSGRGLPLPSYRAVFRTFAMRALVDARFTGNAVADAAIVLRAIRHGRVFTAIDALAGPSRLDFVIRSGAASAGIGDRLIPAGPLRLEIDADAPAGASIVVVANGREVAAGPAPRLRREVAAVPGAYRVEVRLESAPGSPPVPWILSSPIFIGLPASPPQPALAVGVAAMDLTRADDAGAWTVEHSPGSSAVAAAANGGGSVQLTYALDREQHRSQYAALTRPVRIAGTSLIEFHIQADRPMRASVQLRSPEGGGDGLRWSRSIYADQEERIVRLPLADFRPVPPGAGALHQADVDSLLLVIDTVNSLPGTSGGVTLRGVSVY